MDEVRVSEYVNQTTVHPVGALALAVFSAFLLFSPRRVAPLAFILMACLIPSSQRIVFAGLDFNFIRILVIVGMVRVLMNGEYRGLKMIAADWVMLAWAIVSILFFTIQQGSVGSLITVAGKTYEAVGVYFIARCLIRSLASIRTLAIAVAVTAIPVCVIFLIEKLTAKNMFAVFGGVPETTLIRHGRLRCQGAFSHAILAGCFWAGLIPLMGALFWDRSMLIKMLSVAGCFCGAVIIVTTASSTPVLAVLVCFIGGGLIFFRRYMTWIQIGTVCVLIGLHIVMRAPVWHLISRVSAVGGSTGWHRYHLIDEAINRFPEWMLFGTRATAHWGTGLHDVTNQYVLEGVRGGFLRLALFVAVIALCFNAVGRAWRMCKPWTLPFVLCWAVGVALAVHCVSFIGVSYFGQITMLWSLTLALAANLDNMQLPADRAALLRRRARAKAAERAKLVPEAEQP